MKVVAYLIAAMSILFASGACTKPGVEDEGNVLPPTTQEKEDEETPEEPSEPVLESFSTSFGNKAVSGERLVLTGQNFDPKKEGNILLFDDLTCTDIIEAEETKLVAIIPSNLTKETVQLRVATKGGTTEALPIQVDLRRCDSVAVFKGAKVEELRPGVKWTSTITVWKGEPRSINIVSIPKSEFKNLHFTYPSGKVKTSAQCMEVDALVGINGQYFDNSSGGTGLARDFLKIDGVVVTEGSNNRGDTFASGAFIFSENMADIKKVAKNEGARKLTDPNIMVCGPHLIDNGTYRSLDQSTTHNTDTHPRTAVAVTYDDCVLLVTIDGRFPGQAVGMPTTLMQEFFTLLGAKSALNLDGGGSTTMYIKGRGVVNHACDGKNWNNPTERAVNSIIYLK